MCIAVDTCGREINSADDTTAECLHDVRHRIRGERGDGVNDTAAVGGKGQVSIAKRIKGGACRADNAHAALFKPLLECAARVAAAEDHDRHRGGSLAHRKPTSADR